MKAAIGALACALALVAAAPTGAQGASAAPKGEDAAAGEEMDWPAWIEQLQESADKVRGLRRTVVKMDDQVSEMLSRRYPRGEEKQRMLAAQVRAKDELAEAESQHADLLEQARQAGVPQGMLQDYEELEEVPASDE